MIVRRSIGVGIVLFWAVMNFLLIRRQSVAPPPLLTLRGSETIIEASEEWWGIYYRGEKIGYASQSIVPKARGYKLNDYSRINLNLLGTVQPAETRLEMEADEDWILQRFDFALRSKEIGFKARGAVTNNKLSLDIDSAGHRSSREITLTQAPYLLASLKPYVVTQQLEIGKKFYFATFDPSTLSQQVTTIIIEGREQIRIGNRLEPAIKMRQSFAGISVLSWVDVHGRTLKEESPAGMSMTRQSQAEAKNLPSRSVPSDMTAQAAIPVTTSIPNAKSLSAIQLKLGGVDLANFALDGGRQKLTGDRLMVIREDLTTLTPTAIPVKEPPLQTFLQPTAFMQSDHPTIKSLAARIVGSESKALLASIKLKDWVYRELAKEPTISIPNALEVLRVKKGDCNEHTVLFNALARAAGIPAKTVVGVVYLRGAFYYHAWSEIWLGRWVALDSVLNQFPADVTHVKFIEGEIDRQVDILQLIGNLKIEVM
ncbi:MAG TPA: transglutaminase-like domain-containing protein [Candidatus Limnocylindrales bacterium]|nr:transglutaminase-like domain-containing protein [Candidatus Limnocylindrales bacterium]